MKLIFSKLCSYIYTYFLYIEIRLNDYGYMKVHAIMVSYGSETLQMSKMLNGIVRYLFIYRYNNKGF